MRLDSRTIKKVTDEVLLFYRNEGRTHLPWRHTTDPYCILVSEIMLQQTQVDRVIPKYEAFIQKFPTVQKLAKASRHTVLSLWSGLGYNRRGATLHEAAKEIVKTYDGRLPSDARLLTALPGIGPYTASAILAFAFNTDTVILETNIRTVVLHHILKTGTPTDADIYSVVERMYQYAKTQHTTSRTFYSALMDYGAHLKKSGIRINHRSKHYTKQAPFAGSVRQTRGAVMRLLLKEKKIPARDITKLGFANSTQALNGLIADGLIRKKSNAYILCE